MFRSCLVICVITFAVADVIGQSRSKVVKQPREVVEAYQVCTDFQRLLAEDFNFDRAFEATFTKNPARRREVAIAESALDREAAANLDDVTLLGLYKDLSQFLILSIPLLGVDDVEEAELFPPKYEKTLKPRPHDLESAKVFATKLKLELADFRVHVNKLSVKYPSVAAGIAVYKKYLLTPLVPPNRMVKPMTGYSKGRVLRPDEKYYRIEDCAVIREGRQMRLVGFTFIKFRG
jgi:hypothetical protein